MKLLSTTIATFTLAATAFAAPVGADQTEPPVQAYGAGDHAVTALNVLPPGQGKYQNGPEQAAGTQSPHNSDQIEMTSSSRARPASERPTSASTSRTRPSA